MTRWLLAIVAVAGCGLDVPPNVDRDNDLRRDSRDNCPDDANADQSDFDGDGIGDVCDVCDAGESDDVDMDGIPDGCDGCISIGSDADGDGIDDACDDNSCVAPPGDPDADGDGVTDACDACPAGPDHDEDSDGLADACDNCPADPNLDQADAQETGKGGVADGIGDSCDLGGDPHTAWFDAFEVIDTRCYLQGADIQAFDDHLRTGITSALVMFPQHALHGDFTLRTYVTMRPVAVGKGSDAGMLVSDTLEQPGPNRVTCWVTPGTALNGAKVTMEVHSNGALATSVVGNVILASEFVMTLSDTGTDLACSVGGVSLSVGKTGTTTNGLPWYGGVFTARGSSDFAYYYSLD